MKTFQEFKESLNYGDPDRSYEVRSKVFEESPPDDEIETWIEKNKDRFKKEYGDKKGMEVLYGKAWNMYNDKKGK